MIRDPRRFAVHAGIAGAVLLIIWAALVLIFAPPAYARWITGLLGLSLVGAYLYLERDTARRYILSPHLRHGGNAVLFSAAIVAIVALLNVITTRHSFRADLTANRFFSLSDQTRKVLKGLDRDVKITAFFKDGTPERTQLQDLLKEYRHVSGKLKVEFVDPDKDPAKAQIYKISSYNTTVLESGSERKDILAHEIFGFQMRGRGQRPEFKGESAITSGIMSVSQDRQLTIHFLEGHGERSIEDSSENGFNQIRLQLERDNFEVATVNLLKEGKLPDATELLVIAGPKSVIPGPERKILKGFLEGNGRVLVMLEPGRSDSLKGVLADWGLTILSGFAVDPASYYAFTGPAVPIPSYRSHEITRDLLKERVGSVFPLPGALAKSDSGAGMVTALLETGSESWLESNMAAGTAPRRDKGEKRGPLMLAAAVSVSGTPAADDPGSGPPPSRPKLVVFACADFASNKMQGFGANLNLVANAVSWLMESDEGISIRPKSRDRRPLFLTRVQSSLMWYTTMLLIPLAVIGIGVARWWRRRSL